MKLLAKKSVISERGLESENLTFTRGIFPIPIMEHDFGLGCFMDKNLGVFGPERGISTKKDVGNDTSGVGYE